MTTERVGQRSGRTAAPTARVEAPAEPERPVVPTTSVPVPPPVTSSPASTTPPASTAPAPRSAGAREHTRDDSVATLLLENYARTRDDNVRDQLLREYDWLAVRYARRFEGRGEPLDELIQVARIGLFKAIDRYCFHGHTHLPGVITETWQFYAPEDIDYCYRLDGRKAFINVGSVGQPRDGDWRACYVLVDDEAVYYRRVEYDVESTIQKIYDIDDLDNFLGNRLREGR